MAQAFTGGAGMTKTLNALVQSLGPGSVVSVGFMEGGMAGYNGPRPLHGKKETTKKANRQGKQVSAAQVAFWLEYGTTTATAGILASGDTHIPPRPFFRNMITKNSPRWGKLVMAALKLSNYDTRKAMAIVGIRIGEQLQASIVEFKTPRNADSTIKAKGFDDPLIDSHNMLRSVEYAVQDGDRAKIDGGA